MMNPASHPYRDEQFYATLAALKYEASGPWVLAIPRPDLDPSSKTLFSGHVVYDIKKKVDQMATMHVVSVGPGRVRLGYREHIPCKSGDMILVNLREAGHWIVLQGRTYYLFTGDVALCSLYRTTKPTTAPEFGTPERAEWDDAWFWNILHVLNDYVLLGRDPEAEKAMRNGPETRLHIPDQFQTDGTRSDGERDNRFPIVYRRVLGVGPGRWLTRESDLGIVEREETKFEGQPGCMLAMCKTVKAASFTFQGCPLEIMHASSTLVFERELTGPSQVALELHDSVAKPMTWDAVPEDTEEEEDPDTLR